MEAAVLPPYLTDAEVAGICDGVTRPHAQRLYLKRIGIFFVEKPNGRPLVARSEFERVIGAARLDAQNQPAAAGLNLAGLREWAQKRRQHGKTPQER